jgi:hypothetical protein
LEIGTEDCMNDASQFICSASTDDQASGVGTSDMGVIGLAAGRMSTIFCIQAADLIGRRPFVSREIR